MKSFLQSWGRVLKKPHNLFDINSSHDVKLKMANIKNSFITYGNGRSYGDVCFNSDKNALLTRNYNKFIEFDKEKGIIECESGALLKDIQSLIIESNWILPVSPGTQYVTLGGAVANDIHGKNHHRKGTFGNHILKITLIKSDGKVIDLTPRKNKNLFKATIGGLGLTGFISVVRIKLMKIKSQWLEINSTTFEDLESFLIISDKSEKDWEYNVAWVDCLSGKKIKGVFFRANHINNNSRSFSKKNILNIPFDIPFSLINYFSIKCFNLLYFNFHKIYKNKIVHYIPFFYPLDNIKNWNRIYGRKGFYQYQFVVPRDNARKALNDIFSIINEYKTGSFLSVLKTFGNISSPGMLSFPMPGITLALDFPKKKNIEEIFKKFDEVILNNYGKVYPAKDSLMSKDLFVAGYPNYKSFLKFKDKKINSLFYERLMK